MNDNSGFGTNLNKPQAMQPFTFRDCVIKIKEIYEKADTILDNMTKLDVIKQHITTYFENEEPDDVFEGFVRLVNFLDKITTTIAKQHDLSLVKLALESYNQFLDKYPDLSGRKFETHDEDLIFRALQKLATLKAKHAEKIARVFHLEASPILAKKIIAWMLTTEDLPKAVKWMEVLNARDDFPFEQTAIRLIAENQIGVLDIFVGKAQYRLQKIVKYLDKLVECYWKHRPGMDELENQMIRDHKKLMKLAIRYVKSSGLNDNEVPNVMNVRAYEALLYHHFSWQNGERSWNHLEEVALPPLNDCPEIRDHYFNFLCDRGYGDKALHFAQLLHLSESNYPNKLLQFVRQNPANFSIIQDKISRNNQIKKQNEKIEQGSECRLDDGKPIVLVDDLDSFHEVIDILRRGCEKIVGIDAEWRPHFLSTTERVSLLQIAVSNRVYLIDVLWLEEKLKVQETIWMNFFDALFCTEGVRKIGYDFRNDIRVIKSTFPFVTKILPLAKEVVCLYKLLQQVLLIPDASRIVFGSQPPKNMGLSDIAQYFLKIKMEKNEREGNWSQRPLRLEQKKYAALDAHCLVELYRIIAPKIRKLIPDQQMALQKCAIINFVADEEKSRLAPCILADGQVVGKSKSTEAENDFIMNIQKASADLLNGASSSEKLIRSTNDVRFVVDSMLFGLGKKLRICGFETQLIGDREKIINFCQLKNNEDYIVLSTGKGHTRLESVLGAKRCVHVPVSTHTGAIRASLLVNHVMRELKIAIPPEDMRSRCVECNKRAFVSMPSQIVQVIFFMNAVRIGADWLEITEEDLQNAFKKLRDDSELTLGITPEMHTGKQPRQDRQQLTERAYYLYEDSNHIVCETSHFAVDIINKLMLPENCGAPCSIHVGLKYKKAIFDNLDNKFFVCTECGKVQLNNTSEE